MAPGGASQPPRCRAPPDASLTTFQEPHEHRQPLPARSIHQKTKDDEPGDKPPLAWEPRTRDLWVMILLDPTPASVLQPRFSLPVRGWASDLAMVGS